MRDKSGDVVRHKLEDGQDEQSIARVLTMRITKASMPYPSGTPAMRKPS